MKKVYKYELDVADTQTVNMPQGAIIRHIGEQFGRLCMWVEVDPVAPLESRHIEIYGTGHPIQNEEGLCFIGTFMRLDGHFVGNAYERKH